MYNNFITNIFKKTMKNYKELIQSFAQEDYEKGLVNLHIHSTYSDGKGDFKDLIKSSLEKISIPLKGSSINT